MTPEPWIPGEAIILLAILIVCIVINERRRRQQQRSRLSWAELGYPEGVSGQDVSEALRGGQR
jgi:hypothetical protein